MNPDVRGGIDGNTLVILLQSVMDTQRNKVNDCRNQPNDTKKSQQTKYYGVFRTSANLPNVVAPILGAAVIAIWGSTAAVWGVTALVGGLSVFVLIKRK